MKTVLQKLNFYQKTKKPVPVAQKDRARDS